MKIYENYGGAGSHHGGAGRNSPLRVVQPAIQKKIKMHCGFYKTQYI